MDIKQLAEKHEAYIIEQRRYFHTCPEFSLKEYKTTDDIVAELEKMGLKVERFDGICGCVATLEGKKPGATVLLRADIDGLSVNEKTGLPFASKNEGCMHACGHDCHIAMQLGAAKILCDLKDELSGTVKFFFQPAEEVARGAGLAVERGVMDGVDGCFGMHIWGQVDSPKISIESGPRMASCDQFYITVNGTAAHGSAPHLGKDAIYASAAIIMGLQSIASRVNDPLNPLVVTVGTFNGGQRFNIVADKVKMEGTVRTFSREFRMSIEKVIREIAEDTAKAHGCTAEVRYDYMVGPVINDQEEIVELVRNAATKLYGPEILTSTPKLTGSEDFCFLMEKAPGAYAFLGGRSEKVPGSGLSNHHECYTVDEDSLRHGAAIAAQFAYDFLGKKAK